MATGERWRQRGILRYLLFYQRATFIVGVNDRRNDASVTSIDVDEMHQAVDIFEHCIDAIGNMVTRSQGKSVQCFVLAER